MGVSNEHYKYSRESMTQLWMCEYCGELNECPDDTPEEIIKAALKKHLDNCPGLTKGEPMSIINRESKALWYFIQEDQEA